MYKINMQELQDLIRNFIYPTKCPTMVYGPPGVGKSQSMIPLARSFADADKLKFVIWTEASKEEKIKMIKNPADYFVFADQRVAQMDPTDLRGIPNMVSGTDWLETIPMSWIVYCTQPEAHGMIFFDEINLAPPLVAAQAYQIIQERTVADRALSKNVLVVAAGNRQQDKAYVFDMPFPLRDRFAEVEVYPDVESWSKWAYSAKVNPHLIAFVNWKESYLFKVNPKSDDKSSTPRGIHRASTLIGNLDITSNQVHQLVSISCGEAFATEFQGYTKHFAQLNWETIYKKPETVTPMSVDQLWAVTGGLAENYIRERKQDQFDRTVKVILCMKQDFAISTLRMIKDHDFKDFKSFIKKCPDFRELAKKYGKYVID